MNKILILFSHPLFEKSRVHKSLVMMLPQQENIKFHDLYELYPDFNIQIQREKELLKEFDIIIWQHPFYWYSIPPLLKQWIDMVFEFGWAYGPGGEALKGKIVFNVLSTGGREQAYSAEGKNRFEVRHFLAPLEQTVKLCNMTYLAPFVIHGTHLIKPEQIQNYSSQYENLIKYISKVPLEELKKFQGKYLNELIS